MGTEAELISGMQELLSTFFNRTFPQLVSARVTSWGKDPLTRGSYSFLSNRSLPCSSARLAEPVGGLLFAGEATHSSYFGTVHGALDSGRREAERILGWGVTKRDRHWHLLVLQTTNCDEAQAVLNIFFEG